MREIKKIIYENLRTKKLTPPKLSNSNSNLEKKVNFFS